MKKLFTEPPMVSFKRPKNLKDHVVQTKLDNLPSKSSFKTCINKRCKLCPYTSTTESFSSTTTSRCYYIFQGMGCKTRNVVYLITCKSCSKQYVGETKDPLNIRINGHRSSIYTNDQESPIGPHFTWSFLACYVSHSHRN